MKSPLKPRNLDEQISFHPRIAVELKCSDSAALLKDIYYWCDNNLKRDVNVINGIPFTFNSATAFSEKFTWIARRTISRKLKKMEDDGWLFSIVNNDEKYDRTKWYTVDFSRYDRIVLGMRQDGPTKDWALATMRVMEKINSWNGQILKKGKLICDMVNDGGQNGQCIGQNGQCIGQNGPPIPPSTEDYEEERASAQFLEPMNAFGYNASEALDVLESYYADAKEFEKLVNLARFRGDYEMARTPMREYAMWCTSPQCRKQEYRFSLRGLLSGFAWWLSRKQNQPGVMDSPENENWDGAKFILHWNELLSSKNDSKANELREKGDAWAMHKGEAIKNSISNFPTPLCNSTMRHVAGILWLASSKGIARKEFEQAYRAVSTKTYYRKNFSNAYNAIVEAIFFNRKKSNK